MQLVKEHINFERGLDPKSAMDIGIKNKMEKDLKEIDYDINEIKPFDTSLIKFLIEREKYTLLSYLINNKYLDISKYGIPLLDAAYSENKEKLKFLINIGFSVELALSVEYSPISKRNLKKFIETGDF